MQLQSRVFALAVTALFAAFASAQSSIPVAVTIDGQSKTMAVPLTTSLDELRASVAQFATANNLSGENVENLVKAATAKVEKSAKALPVNIDGKTVNFLYRVTSVDAVRIDTETFCNRNGLGQADCQNLWAEAMKRVPSGTTTVFVDGKDIEFTFPITTDDDIDREIRTFMSNHQLPEPNFKALRTIVMGEIRNPTEVFKITIDGKGDAIRYPRNPTNEQVVAATNEFATSHGIAAAEAAKVAQAIIVRRDDASGQHTSWLRAGSDLQLPFTYSKSADSKTLIQAAKEFCAANSISEDQVQTVVSLALNDIKKSWEKAVTVNSDKGPLTLQYPSEGWSRTLAVEHFLISNGLSETHVDVLVQRLG